MQTHILLKKLSKKIEKKGGFKVKNIANVILYLFSIFVLIWSNSSFFEILVISFLFLLLTEAEDRNHKDSISDDSTILDDSEK